MNTDNEQIADYERLRAAFLAGAAAQQDLEYAGRNGVHFQIESYFEEFWAELNDGCQGDAK